MTRQTVEPISMGVRRNTAPTNTGGKQMWTRLTTAQLSDLSDAEILEYYRQGGPEAFLDVRDEHDDQWPGKTFVYNLPIGANDEIKAIRAKAVEMARKSNSNKN